MVHSKVKVLNNLGGSRSNNNNNIGSRTKRHSQLKTNKKNYVRIVLLSVFFIIGLLINGDIHPLVRRGFFCSDSSILYPYKTDTVGIKTLMVLALILPGILINLCDKKLKLNLRKVNPPSVYDSVRYRLNKRRVSGPQGEVTVEEKELMTHVKRRNYTIHEGHVDDQDYCEEAEPMNVDYEVPQEIQEFRHQHNANSDTNEAGSASDESSDAEISLFSRIPLDDETERKRDYMKTPICCSPGNRSTNLVTRSFGEFQLFFFGLCCTIFITGLGKITGGRLRPHFMDKCRPNVDCLLPENAHRYIENFTCQNITPKEYPYITTSWPSGHASVIFYSMTYLILYLNSVIPIFYKLSRPRIRWRYNPIYMYSLYLLMAMLAFWVAVTRVSDYHHHAVDVASGSVLGLTIAITLSALYSKPFL